MVSSDNETDWTEKDTHFMGLAYKQAQTGLSEGGIPIVRKRIFLL